MANNYVQAAFAVTMNAHEAMLISGVLAAITAIEDDLEGAERSAAFEALGTAFAAAFPGDDDDPFAGVIAIFPDPDFPALDADVTIEDGREPDTKIVSFSGDQFGVEQIANLIFACAKSALPVAFEYAWTCERLRHGEFGGGAVVIDHFGVRYRNTADILREALEAHSDEGARGYVLATGDLEHGLSFWNTKDGFGRLANATVFTDRDAANLDKPIANDEPEWLVLPADIL